MLAVHGTAAAVGLACWDRRRRTLSCLHRNVAPPSHAWAAGDCGSRALTMPGRTRVPLAACMRPIGV